MDENKSASVTSESPQNTIPSPTNTVGKLPPFSLLYKESWQLLRRTFSSVVKLFLLSILAIFGVVAILAGGVFIGSLVIPSLGAFNAVIFIGAFVLLIFYIVSVVYISSVSQITYVKIFVSETNLPLLQTIKDSKHLIIPYFTTLLLAQLLIVGGLSLFILPGIVFGCFFLFVTFVIVVENLRGKEALKRSYQLIKPNFWRIFGAIALVVVPLNIISQLLSRMAEENNWIFLIAIPFSIGISLYTQALSVVLYKRVKAITPTTPVNMKWVWVVAIIGWVVGAALLIFTVSMIAMNPTDFYNEVLQSAN